MKRFSIRPTLTLKGRTFKGLRGWSGKPLHPPLTDIPIIVAVLVSFGATFGGRGAGLRVRLQRRNRRRPPRLAQVRNRRLPRSAPRRSRSLRR